MIGGGKSAPQPKPEEGKYFADLAHLSDWNDALKKVNRRFDDYSAAMNLPTVPEQVKALEKVETEFIKWKAEVGPRAMKFLAKPRPLTKEATNLLGDMAVFMLTPTLIDHKLSTRAMEHRELCKAALALRAYIVDQGQHPEKLEELVPKYLKAVPKDIFSGEAIKYKPKQTGYVIYSIGYDLKDDGGDGGKNGQEPDIVIECKN